MESIKAKVLMSFTRQLATLIEAGFPLLKGLSILNQQEKDPTLRKVISSISHSIHNGATLFESLERHPKIFNKLFVSMVQAGEAGGILAPTFLRLSEFQEKALKLKNKIITAIAYPFITLLAAIVILCFLLGIILPKFQLLLPEIVGDKPLPALTNFIVNLSNLFQQNFFILLAGLFTFFITFQFALRTQKGQYYIDTWKLKIPILGNIIRQYAISRFTRTLGTLIANGIPILQALTLSRETINNAHIASAIDKVHPHIKAGASLGHSLAASKAFPPLVVSMISVGEETGRLPQMLLKIADLYEEEVENIVTVLTSLIEPFIIILLALLVGVIVLTLFLPLISLGDSFFTL